MNDNVPPTITMQASQARWLAEAGNLLSEVWGDLHEGELTYVDFAARLRDCGLATVTPDGVIVLQPDFCAAVLGVSVALDHIDGEDAGEWGGFDEDVEAAEAAFGDEPDSVAPA